VIRHDVAALIYAHTGAAVLLASASRVFPILILTSPLRVFCTASTMAVRRLYWCRGSCRGSEIKCRGLRYTCKAPSSLMRAELLGAVSRAWRSTTQPLPYPRWRQRQVPGTSSTRMGTILSLAGMACYCQKCQVLARKLFGDTSSSAEIASLLQLAPKLRPLRARQRDRVRRPGLLRTSQMLARSVPEL